MSGRTVNRQKSYDWSIIVYLPNIYCFIHRVVVQNCTLIIYKISILFILSSVLIQMRLRTFRLSEDLCENYYSHLNFAVVTFLTKFQNWCYETKRNLNGKNYHHPKILDGKNCYHPRILTTIQNVESSRIAFSLFY